MTWNEDAHPRNAHGEFTRAAVGAWAEQAFASLGDALGNRNHPPGHAAAAREHARLWAIPETPERGGLGRDRTDAEHDEAMRLDDAFETYRDELGLESNPDDRGNERTYVHPSDHNVRFNQYGERLNRPRGYSRSPSMRRRIDVGERRRGDLRSGSDGDREVRQTGQVLPREGRFGYGARSDLTRPEGGLEAAIAFVAAMKRVQPRARQETAREPVRRTPRGTRIEGWMQHVNDQIEQTRGRETR